MLSAFFRETSIHGLRYVVEAKGILSKSLWALIVLASVTTAGYLIVLNLIGWAQSPAMVTDAGMAVVVGNENLIKLDHSYAVEETNLPMLTICPRYSNTANLLFNLLSDTTPEALKETMKTMQGATMFEKIRTEGSQRANSIPEDVYLS